MRRVSRYASVGLATLAVYLAVGHLLAEAGAPAFWKATLPFFVAVAMNYLMQRGWVFDDARPIHASLPRYVLMVGVGSLVNAAGFWSSPFDGTAWTQLYSATLVVMSNAVLSFLWVFRHARPETALRR